MKTSPSPAPPKKRITTHYFGRPLSFLDGSPPSLGSVEAVEAAERFRSGPSVPGPAAAPAVRALHVSVRDLETSRGVVAVKVAPFSWGDCFGVWRVGLVGLVIFVWG